MLLNYKLRNQRSNCYKYALKLFWNYLMKEYQQKRKKNIVPNLQYCKFEQDGWKNRIFFRKNKLNMSLYSNI